MRKAVVAVAFISLCGSAPTRATPPACPAPSSTFDLIQRGIFEQHSCTQSFCHGQSAHAGLDLRAANAYASLLQQHQRHNVGETMVDPGRPQHSLLWLALAAKTLQLRNADAEPMPVDALPISTDELEGVRLWIMAGAPADGVVRGVAELVQPCASSPVQGDAIPPACTARDHNLLLPDLVPDPPADVRLLYQNGHRVLQFTTGIANVGAGPLIVQAAEPPVQAGQSLNAVQILLRADGSQCSRAAGQIMYEVDGKKWSYGNMADFELRKDDPLTGAVVARSSKSVFCLLDTDPIRAWNGATHQFDAHCTDEIGRMGISVGYKDLYHRVQPGQWLDLDADPTTAVDPGTYYLVNIVDPNGTVAESDTNIADRTSYTRVTIRLADPDPPAASAPTGPVPRVLHRPQPSHVAHPSHPAHAPHPPHRPTHAD